MNILVSGLINIESTLKIDNFPIEYCPVEYPFFGIKSDVSGVAYNVAKAFLTLNNTVELVSFLGDDQEGKRIRNRLIEDKLGQQYIQQELAETPVTIALYDNQGKRKIYCDLKDIQEKQLNCHNLEQAIKASDLVVACNINFNRSLLKKAKELGKIIASDVHVLNDLEDEYNKDFMEYADVLFLSDEKLPCKPEAFLYSLKEKYGAKIIVIGMGNKGALLYERKTDNIYQLGIAHVGEVVNTLGAGDALFTGFLNYWGQGYDAIEALKRAEIFAALKITVNGASKGFSDEKIVEDYYQKTEITVKEINSCN